MRANKESPFLNSASNPLPLSREERCNCGQLLAILTEEGVEIKCKRCKRVHTISAHQLYRLIQGQRTDEFRSILCNEGNRT